MQSLRLEPTCSQDGELTLRDLPLHKGDAVEAIIFSRASATSAETLYRLRGEPVTYHRPTDPVAEDDWEAAS